MTPASRVLQRAAAHAFPDSQAPAVGQAAASGDSTATGSSSEDDSTVPSASKSVNTAAAARRRRQQHHRRRAAGAPSAGASRAYATEPALPACRSLVFALDFFTHGPLVRAQAKPYGVRTAAQYHGQQQQQQRQAYARPSWADSVDVHALARALNGDEDDATSLAPSLWARDVRALTPFSAALISASASASAAVASSLSQVYLVNGTEYPLTRTRVAGIITQVNIKEDDRRRRRETRYTLDDGTGTLELVCVSLAQNVYGRAQANDKKKGKRRASQGFRDPDARSESSSGDSGDEALPPSLDASDDPHVTPLQVGTLVSAIGRVSTSTFPDDSRSDGATVTRALVLVDRLLTLHHPGDEAAHHLAVAHAHKNVYPVRPLNVVEMVETAERERTERERVRHERIGEAPMSEIAPSSDAGSCVGQTSTVARGHSRTLPHPSRITDPSRLTRALLRAYVKEDLFARRVKRTSLALPHVLRQKMAAAKLAGSRHMVDSSSSSDSDDPSTPRAGQRQPQQRWHEMPTLERAWPRKFTLSDLQRFARVRHVAALVWAREQYVRAELKANVGLAGVKALGKISSVETIQDGLFCAPDAIAALLAPGGMPARMPLKRKSDNHDTATGQEGETKEAQETDAVKEKEQRGRLVRKMLEAVVRDMVSDGIILIADDSDDEYLRDPSLEQVETALSVQQGAKAKRGDDNRSRVLGSDEPTPRPKRDRQATAPWDDLPSSSPPSSSKGKGSKKRRPAAGRAPWDDSSDDESSLASLSSPPKKTAKVGAAPWDDDSDSDDARAVLALKRRPHPLKQASKPSLASQASLASSSMSTATKRRLKISRKDKLAAEKNPIHLGWRRKDYPEGAPVPQYVLDAWAKADREEADKVAAERAVAGLDKIEPSADEVGCSAMDIERLSQQSDQTSQLSEREVRPISGNPYIRSVQPWFVKQEKPVVESYYLVTPSYLSRKLHKLIRHEVADRLRTHGSAPVIPRARKDEPFVKPPPQWTDPMAENDIRRLLGHDDRWRHVAFSSSSIFEDALRELVTTGKLLSMALGNYRLVPTELESVRQEVGPLEARSGEISITWKSTRRA